MASAGQGEESGEEMQGEANGQEKARSNRAAIPRDGWMETGKTMRLSSGVFARYWVVER